MKTISLLIFLLFCTFSAISQEKTYLIKSELTGIKDGTKIFLSRFKSDDYDSTIAKNNKFIFKGRLAEPDEAVLAIGSINNIGKRDISKVIWIEPGTIHIKGNFNNIPAIEVTGSASNEEYQQLIRFLAEHEKSITDGYSDTATVHLISTFIAKHPQSYVSAQELYLLRMKIGFQEVGKLYSKLGENIKSSVNGKALRVFVNNFKNYKIGDTISNLVLKNINGETFNTKDLKGRYYLINFWSSWCAPCRHENVVYQKLYLKFKPYGFEIIGIGLDDNVAFSDAIKKDGVTWLNFIDNRGFKSPIAQTFGVWFLPSTFLVDPHGVLIGQNFTERSQNSLSGKLEEIFSTTK